jgi:hypothetical protein
LLDWGFETKEDINIKYMLLKFWVTWQLGPWDLSSLDIRER